MGEAAANKAENEVTRPVDICPQCGYSLNGISEEGRCPECGAAYDQSVVILHGVAAGTRAHLGNVSRRQLVYFIFILLIQIWFYGRGFKNFHHIAFYCLSGAMIVGLLYVLLRRSSNHRPGLVRVYLSPDGCLQEESVELPAILRIGTIGILVPACMLIATLSMLIEWLPIEVQAVIFITVALLLICWAIWIWLDRPEPTEHLPPAQAIVSAGEPWSRLIEVEIKQRLNDQVYLRIQKWSSPAHW